MTDTKNEIVQQRDWNSSTISDVNDDIIDVTALHFGNPDTWLQHPGQDFEDDGICDIRAWMRNQTEQGCNNSQGEPHTLKGTLCIRSSNDKKSIDTGTFTRPRKSRSGRLSFESIVDTNVRRSSNVWNQVSPSISREQVRNDDTGCTKTVGESMPDMLRSPIPGVNNLYSTYNPQSSGQESLKALNMRRSKAIDSFINLVEPELNEDLMDTSPPSFLYSSMMSIKIDDLSPMMNHSMTLNQSQISRHSGMEDSQILTESMMQTSMFNDVVDVLFNDTFAKNDADMTVLENTSYLNPMDTTFLARPVVKPTETLNSTFNTVTFNRGDIQSMDTTYTPSQCNLTVTNDPPALHIVDSSTCQPNIMDNFNATFDKTPTSSLRKSSITSAHEARLSENELPTMTNERVINETFKASSWENISVKLDENVDLASQAHEMQNFDATSKKTQASLPRKLSIKLAPKARLPANHVPKTMNELLINETFKAASCEKISAKLDENVDPMSRGGSHDNFRTFCQAAPKIPRQLNIPPPLSRLHQSLQKSNSTLSSNILKTNNNNPKLCISRSGIPSLDLNKTARPGTARNVESSLSSKLYGVGKMNGGSEQRLSKAKNLTELQSMRSGGSTESMNSTQIAQSASDFDDRLSVRSDGSNASYNIRTMNIGDFQKIVRMRGECFKQESTPKPRRPVLKNNWIAASKDLPSPILRNNPDTYSSCDNSLRNTHSTVKTSSPLLSPTGSQQSLTTDVVKSNNYIKGNKRTIPRIKTAISNKTSQASEKPQRNPCQEKSELRLPSNWTSANKPASGIPRSSRIPAPKFIRPDTKINQGDMKK